MTLDLSTWRSRARKKQGKLVFPEGENERIIQAAESISQDKLAQPILLGSKKVIRTIAAGKNVDLSAVEIIDPLQCDVSAYVPIYLRRRPRSSEKLAQRLLKKNLYLAAFMVAASTADAMVAGVSHTTARVIEAGQMGIGLAEGISTPSSFFLMVLPRFNGVINHKMIFADCAVNIEPDARQLADITLASAASAEYLLDEKPRIALLSFSTLGSAKHERVDKVREAVRLATTERSDIAIEGELQADAALVATVADVKVKSPGAVAGQANVLIFPNLESGNIAYKLTQYLAGAQAIGPFLQGFARPVSDLSRGASVNDIVNTSVIVMAAS